MQGVAVVCVVIGEGVWRRCLCGEMTVRSVPIAALVSWLSVGHTLVVIES